MRDSILYIAFGVMITFAFHQASLWARDKGWENEAILHRAAFYSFPANSNKLTFHWYH